MPRKFVFKQKSSEVGFTLIELLAVVVILGILGAIAIIGVSSARDSAAKQACKSSLTEIQNAVDTYYLQGSADGSVLPGNYPGTVEEMVGSYLRNMPTANVGGADVTFTVDGGVATATPACE